MEEIYDGPKQSEHGPSSSTLWASDFVDKFGSISLASQGVTLNQKDANCDPVEEDLPSQTVSEIFWSTGILSEPITDGFYSIAPDKRLKEMFHRLPTLEELSQLEVEGYIADVIVVDTQRDKKLVGLKQLIAALVKGLNSDPPAMIKKIAGLVSDLYKRPNLDLSPGRGAVDEASHASVFRGFQRLGQIKHGSCRPRAILFKFLADTVGLKTRLMLGLPSEGEIGCTDSYKHTSVTVILNSVELLIDLMRFPGQLIPLSAKAIFMTHISAAGDSDSAENDSCDSPLEPNSPLYGISKRLGSESHVDKDDTVRHPRRLDTSANTSDLSLQSSLQRSASALSLSHSEPNVATSFLQRSWRKGIAEQHTASSSPEHPSFRAHGRSMLGGERKLPRDYGDDAATSRSGGAPSPEAFKYKKRRSISITPEIGDEIVRAVRAMNETLKQNRLPREQVGASDASLLGSPIGRISTDPQKNHGEGSSQRAISLPSSPHEFRGPNTRTSQLDHATNEMVSTWNKILECHMNDDRSLLPYAEWNIDFSELTVGTRVGIGCFGEVFRGIWNGTEVAIKVFLEQDLTAENMEDFCNEILILSRLRHPNVILFLGGCTKPPHLSMVTEYMEMGSLYFLIHQKLKLSWRRRLKMLRDICRGLMCIHRMKIVHRDLKSANCLVNKHWTVKICDFGLSRIMTETPMKNTSSAGTPEWMAPELIRDEPFTEKCDIFSLGVIMWELCTLSRPWKGATPDRVVYAVAHEGLRLEIPQGPLGKLIADCWAEPNDRPSCEEILSRLVDCECVLC